MAWAIDTSATTAINSFEAANHHWESEKPWRNECQSKRPLDSRRKLHMHLIKLSDDAGYQCMLYRTPVATYLADGSVILQSYDSASTYAFAWKMKPHKCWPISHSGEMWWGVTTDDGAKYYREGRERLRLSPTPAGNWLLTSTPADSTELKYDSKLGARARKLTKPYTDWYKLTVRVTGRAPSKYSRMLLNQMHVKQLLADPANHEFYPELMERAGTPEAIKRHAYSLLGVYKSTPVPPDRLPRKDPR